MQLHVCVCSDTFRHLPCLTCLPACLPGRPPACLPVPQWASSWSSLHGCSSWMNQRQVSLPGRCVSLWACSLAWSISLWVVAAARLSVGRGRASFGVAAADADCGIVELVYCCCTAAGLDSEMAVSLVDTLVSLARQNRTVGRAGQPAGSWQLTGRNLGWNGCVFEAAQQGAQARSMAAATCANGGAAAVHMCLLASRRCALPSTSPTRSSAPNSATLCCCTRDPASTLGPGPPQSTTLRARAAPAPRCG